MAVEVWTSICPKSGGTRIPINIILADTLFDITSSKPQYIDSPEYTSITDQRTELNSTGEVPGEDRVSWLRHACETVFPLPTVNDKYTQFHQIIDKVRNVMYCYVPKASSTSWKSLFMVSNNLAYKKFFETSLTNGDSIGPYVERYRFNKLSNVTQNGSFETKKYLKFVFVRNPINRILSAYRSKFVWKNKYFVNHYERYIKVLAHRNSSEISDENFDVIKAMYDNKEVNVTFLEFVQFIINIPYVRDVKLQEYLMNEHWRPISDICAPCTYGLDFIGKQETLVEDVTKIMGLTTWNTLNYNPFKTLFPPIDDDAEGDMSSNNLESESSQAVTSINLRQKKIVIRNFTDYEKVLIESLPEDVLIRLIRLFRYDYLFFYPSDPLYLKYLHRL
ncbi:carbohydrate sulfotransferase 11-like [Gordionus sp. m RMFG-2023]|uniref:carbohydrate sulfotransferase 11-like n=1 Tax=Gordionus sp. m RMFG-2023 TaxID=3053472 RepID=UPI0031FCDDE0